jgi:hypothetical protein
MNDLHRHEEISELLVPYALRMLDPAERELVERALEHDPALREELAGIEATGAAMLGGMPRVAAPASVKANVMSAVRASNKPVEVPEPPIATERPASASASRRPRRRWFASPALSFGLAAACVALGILAVDLSRELDAANDRAADLEQVVEDRPTGAPAGFERATQHTVVTTHDFSSANGSLIQVDDDTWLLAFNDVPEPAAGKSWQVWTASSDGTIENVAQWAEGDANRLLVLDSEDIVEVMVSYEPTLEPAPAPTGEPVADVKV